MARATVAKTTQKQGQQAETSSSGELVQRSSLSSAPYGDVLALQEAIGNRDLNELLRWTKPTVSHTVGIPVSQPSDREEKEAKNIAAKAIHAIASGSQTFLRRSDENKDLRAQTEPSLVETDVAVSTASTAPTGLTSVANGHPLPDVVRVLMERLFQTNLDKVRVHSDSDAQWKSSFLNANAFTVGQDIYFQQGEYEPYQRKGQELIAHELIHIFQQQCRPKGRIFRDRRTRQQIAQWAQQARSQLSSTVSRLGTQRQQELLQTIISVIQHFFPRGFGVKDAQGTVLESSVEVSVEQPVRAFGAGGDYIHRVTVYLSEEQPTDVRGEYRGQNHQGEIILYVPNLINGSVTIVGDVLVHETVHLFTDVLDRARLWGIQQQGQSTSGTGVSPAPPPAATGAIRLNIGLTNLDRLRSRSGIQRCLAQIRPLYERIIQYLHTRGSRGLDVQHVTDHWVRSTLDEMLAFAYTEVVSTALQSPRGVALPTSPSSPAYIMSYGFDPIRFFYDYAFSSWVDDPADRVALASPSGRQVVEAVGRHRVLNDLYSQVLSWLHE
jgi:hypothetical protein